MTVLSGRELAATIRARVGAEAAALAAGGVTPLLAVVTATTDSASAWYLRSIVAAATKVGITADVIDLSAAPEHLPARLAGLANDPAVHAMILQTPLPGNAPLAEVAAAIPPDKDVDGANPASLGRVLAGLPAYAPATAAAVVALLEHHQVPLAGRRAVVVGRSTVVGKPLAHLLLDRDATVTVCHSRTVDLASVTQAADVLVVAAGRPALIGAGHVRPEAVVIDVGTNPTSNGAVVGDVDPAVAEHVSGLSPVPGGVGPVTTAMLLQHTVAAAQAVARP